MATQYIKMRSVGEEMEVTEAECLFTVDTKLVLFKLGCYKFKIPIIITKITIKKITRAGRVARWPLELMSNIHSQLNMVKTELLIMSLNSSGLYETGKRHELLLVFRL